MDLCESQPSPFRRHPWEIARLEAVKDILEILNISKNPTDGLDIGCGDGFIGKELSASLPLRTYTGIDPNLSAARREEMSIPKRGIFFLNDYRDLDDNRYSLVLMLDVLEHVEYDRRFLADLVDRHAISGGHFLITVPAFPCLFGDHDRFLKHYRRYRRSELIRLIEDARLICVAHGYMFTSLLLVREISSICGKLFPPKTKRDMGVGNWDWGEFLSKGIGRFLRIDNWISSILNRIGIKLPGLTIWALCKKP